MEEKWLAYLKENAPELYANAVESVTYQMEWRDKEIKRLREVVSNRNEALLDITYAVERITHIVRGELSS